MVIKMKKVILIDGNNLLFRSYYATAYSGTIMRNSKGFPTNALFGFISMINKIIEEEKPKYVMVAFDKGKTFRNEKYETYKDGRSETPDELKQQFPLAKDVLEAMGIEYFDIDNYEADDIIGTFAKMTHETDEFDATIISSDKDLLQLIEDDVEVKLLKQSGHIRMTKEEFFNTYGLDPIKMVDLKALMGDSSDNIPGVKGIGEKTALKLLQTYNSLDELYNNIESITGKTKEKLLEDKENAYMSYDLATIYKEVPVRHTLEELKYEGINVPKYKNLLTELEFGSLLKKIPKTEENNLPKTNIETKDINIEELLKEEEISFYIVSSIENYHDIRKEDILGISIKTKKNEYFTNDIDSLKDLFTNNIKKTTYDIKRSIVILNNLGINLNNCYFDTMIAYYLLNYDLKQDPYHSAQRYSYYTNPIKDIVKDKKNENVELSIKEYALNIIRFIYGSKDDLLENLQKEEQEKLFYDIEIPLATILADMEITGIDVSKNYLETMGKEVLENIIRLEKDITTLAGHNFNIQSPKQLGDVLFNKLEIPYPKKIKDDNYSTSRDILDKLVDHYPIVNKVLEYRTLTKIYNNYIIGMIAEIKTDNKIHTIYNQTLTRTGRLSSISPNLQNIPIREELGRLIRKGFLPSNDCILLSSDYSQIELRVFAHMSKADNLIQAFKEDKDIHSKTASDIYKVDINMVDKNMRRTAKAVNFGILYGISSFGLSEDLGIDVYEAKNFIDTYLTTYPGIKNYMDRLIENAKSTGFVKTLMNRKREIPEIMNKNYMIRSQGERMALNTPIQGTSADILKLAMIEIYNKLKEKNLKTKMILQVHDELVFNCYKDELEEIKSLVKETMENTIKLDVPLKVEIETGNNWYEAK